VTSYKCRKPRGMQRVKWLALSEIGRPSVPKLGLAGLMNWGSGTTWPSNMVVDGGGCGCAMTAVLPCGSILAAFAGR